MFSYVTLQRPCVTRRCAYTHTDVHVTCTVPTYDVAKDAFKNYTSINTDSDFETRIWMLTDHTFQYINRGCFVSNSDGYRHKIRRKKYIKKTHLENKTKSYLNRGFFYTANSDEHISLNGFNRIPPLESVKTRKPFGKTRWQLHTTTDRA